VQDRLADRRPSVMLSANTFWYIDNFRSGLVDALVAKGCRVVIATPDADAGWASAKGVEAAPIAVDRSGLNPFRDVKLFFTYIDLISRCGTEFFLGYTAKPNIYGSLAARVRGARAIPNISGLGTAFINPGPLSALVGALYRIALAKCPVVFFENGDDSELFVRRKIVRQEQVRLVPGAGVDLETFSAIPPDTGEVRFLFIGRLLGDKGIREFVEAARILRAEQPGWRFQLLGPLDEGNRSGVRREELDQWIEQGLVEYLGQTDDVRPFIGAATAVVLPSYREGLPGSLLEAAAMARPLVATDVPGNRRIARDGVNAILCEPRDALSLADAMRRMGCMEQEACMQMGSAGRELVEREFGEQLVIAAYLETIAQLLGDARVQPV
jgi:glycosyltransferase involved in cell wall biosynthesis